MRKGKQTYINITYEPELTLDKKQHWRLPVNKLPYIHICVYMSKIWQHAAGLFESSLKLHAAQRSTQRATGELKKNWCRSSERNERWHWKHTRHTDWSRAMVRLEVSRCRLLRHLYICLYVYAYTYKHRHMYVQKFFNNYICSNM